jgi:pantoate kinase
VQVHFKTTYRLTITQHKEVAMPIIVIDNQYPHHKNKEVVETWLKALEKHPRPEGLFTPLIETAVRSGIDGLQVLSAYQASPGKYEEAVAYFARFMTEFFEIEGYSYDFSTWMTIDEAMASIGQKAPER